MPELSWEKTFSESVVRDVPNQFTDYAVFNIVQNNINIKQLEIWLIDGLDLLALLALGMSYSTDYAVINIVQNAFLWKIL